MHQDDAVQRPSSEADGSPKDMVDEDDDQSMAVEEDEPGKAKEKTTTKTSRQNEKLYAIDGMLNTKKKKAEKKMRKKAKSASKDAMEDDDDYDFKVDYVKKGSAMDVTDGTGRNDEGQITGKVPMSGIGFDEPEEE
ncbi:hypothetical protein ACLB2K_026529 [Fragaria x ananassa]